jgi:hypothetical protein
MVVTPRLLLLLGSAGVGYEACGLRRGLGLSTADEIASGFATTMAVIGKHA